MPDDWRTPLDRFTLRFLLDRLTEDRENHLEMAKAVESHGEEVVEKFMIRAEECGRVIVQLRKLMGEYQSDPPPPPKKPAAKPPALPKPKFPLG
jgi:hypothetical protein